MLQLDSSPQNAANAMVSAPGRYVFPTWWGGMAMSPEPPQIADKLVELRMAVGGIAAKKVQGDFAPKFPVRGAKELAQKLAQALSDLNMVAPTVAQEINLVPTETIPDNKTASGKPVFRTLAHIKATVRIGAPDGSFVECVGSGHGGDVDDKAGGKASTYAWKDAIFKGLTVPDQDMVDTDDEEPSASKGGPTRNDVPSKATTAGSKIKAPSADGGASVNAIIAEVAVADEDALEAIKKRIMSGEAGLSGADKLKASAAFVARRKAIEESKNTKETK